MPKTKAKAKPKKLSGRSLIRKTIEDEMARLEGLRDEAEDQFTEFQKKADEAEARSDDLGDEIDNLDDMLTTLDNIGH